MSLPEILLEMNTLFGNLIVDLLIAFLLIFLVVILLFVFGEKKIY